MNALLIFRRELKTYFNTPIAYVFVPLFLTIPALYFLKDFHLVGEASLRKYFLEFAPVSLAILVALLGMRMWAEEFSNGTAELLLTLPYKVKDIVLGKIMAGTLMLMVCLATTAGLPLMIGILGEPDWGPVISSYLGSFLLGFFLLCMSSFFSSVTRNQMIACVLTVVVSLLLIYVFSEQFCVFFNARWAVDFFRPIGVYDHLESFTRGLVTLRDCVYFLSLSAFFLMLTVFSLGCRRY